MENLLHLGQKWLFRWQCLLLLFFPSFAICLLTSGCMKQGYCKQACLITPNHLQSRCTYKPKDGVKDGRNYDLIMQTPHGAWEEHSVRYPSYSYQILTYPSLTVPVKSFQMRCTMTVCKLFSPQTGPNWTTLHLDSD